MKVAYERVSTTQQSTLRQEMMMQEHGIEKVFSEKVSGKDRNRPELEKMLAFVREGDIVLIESISRLARSTRDFLNILNELEQKHVTLVSLKEQIDTSTPTGRFLVSGSPRPHAGSAVSSRSVPVELRTDEGPSARPGAGRSHIPSGGKDEPVSYKSLSGRLWYLCLCNGTAR